MSIMHGGEHWVLYMYEHNQAIFDITCYIRMHWQKMAVHAEVIHDAAEESDYDSDGEPVSDGSSDSQTWIWLWLLWVLCKVTTWLSWPNPEVRNLLYFGVILTCHFVLLCHSTWPFLS